MPIQPTPPAPEGRQPAPPEGDDRRALRPPRRGARDRARRSSTPSCPATSPSCCSASTCCRCCPRSTRCSRRCAASRAEYIAIAEKLGHSEDVCTYVKCDIGMLKSGNIGPTGERLPKPDLLLLSYTGCFTFMKWFELLREEYDCPVAMLHVPYQADGAITDSMRDYVVDAAARRGDPGARADLRQARTTRTGCKEHARALGAGRGRPGLGAGVGEAPALADRRLLRRRLLHRPDLHAPSAAPRTRSTTTASCAPRSRSASRAGTGPVTPDGDMERERFRIVVEGPAQLDQLPRSSGRCSPTRARSSSPRPTRRSAASTTSGFRHDPDAPARDARRLLPRLLHQPRTCRRASTCSRATCAEYEADGFLINSVKSCNSFSAGQLHDPARGRERGRAGPAASSRAIWSTRATSRRPTSRTGSSPTSRCSSRSALRRRGMKYTRRHRSRLDDDQGGRPRRGRRACSAAASPTAAATTTWPARSRSARRSSTRASRWWRGALERAGVDADAERAAAGGARAALPRASSTCSQLRVLARETRAASSSAAARARAAAWRARRPHPRRDGRRRSPALFAPGRRAQERLLPRPGRQPLPARSPRSEARASGVPLRPARRASSTRRSSRSRTRPRRPAASRTTRARRWPRCDAPTPTLAAAVTRGRSRRRSSRSAASAPATAASGCRFPKEQIRSEILCHGLGAHAMFPRTRTVLDIGGQDTKAIQVDEQGIVTSFQMNDRCAAGCGRYLGYIADEMNLGPARARAAGRAVDAPGAHQLDVHRVRRRRAARAPVARREARGHPRRPAPRHHPARDVAARALGRRAATSSRSPAASRKNPAAVERAARSSSRENYGDVHDQHLPRLDLHRRARRRALRAARGQRREPARPALRATRAMADGPRQRCIDRVGHRRRLRRPSRSAIAATTDDARRRARCCAGVSERIRRRDPRPVAEGAVRAAAGRGRPARAATSPTSPRPARASSIAVPHRPLLRHDDARARRALPRPGGARRARHRRAARARGPRWTSARKVLGYRMTSQCASGSGQFLENIARYLGVTLEEIGPLSLPGRRARRPARRSARCWPRPTSSTWSRAASRSRTSSRASTSRWRAATCALIVSAASRGVVLVTGGLAADVGLVAALREAAAGAEGAASTCAATSTRSSPARSARRCGARSARASWPARGVIAA